MKSIARAFSVGMIFLGIASGAHAATDGTLGSTSTGTLSITLGIQDLVRISGLADMALGNYTGAGDLNSNEDVCVYRNGPSGQYKVTASASEGAFALKAGSNAIPYKVYFNDATGVSGETLLTYSAISGAQSGANNQSVDCSVGGKSSNVHVQLLETDLQAAAPGAYSGTLILTVEPA
jgi:hypothetical protein